MIRIGDNTFRSIKDFHPYLVGVLDTKMGHASQKAKDAETDADRAYWHARADGLADVRRVLASATWEDDAPFVLGVVAVGALLLFGTVWSIAGSGWVALGTTGGYLGICGLVAWWRA